MSTRERLAAALWLLLMLAWLGGLLHGMWLAWPVLRGPAAAQEVVVAAMWIIIVGATWLLALSFGLQRYWRPRR